MSLELIASNLSLERGGRRLQTGLDFRATAGTALLLTGPNGTGKTTLLRTIAGFIRPAAGTLRLSGTGSRHSGEDTRQNGAEPSVAPRAGDDAHPTIGESCHLVGHLNAVKPGLSVLENARFWAAYLGTATDRPDSAVRSALARFHLDGLLDVPAGYLSAGQKRRLGLSRLLLAARPIWLLDEPTVSLDKDSTAILADLANAHLTGGGIVIAATHLPLGLAPAIELALRPHDGTATAFDTCSADDDYAPGSASGHSPMRDRPAGEAAPR